MEPGYSPNLDDRQYEEFTRHLASRSVRFVCPFCGHGYGRPTFASVPALMNDQRTPVTRTRPLVQAEFTNCGHVAHFSVSLGALDDT